jgi:hypothetical protein
LDEVLPPGELDLIEAAFAANAGKTPAGGISSLCGNGERASFEGFGRTQASVE